MMDWLPLPSDFRGDLRAAVQNGDADGRLAALAALARHRLGFVETIQLDSALGRTCTEHLSGFSKVRLAILASATVDHLVPAIRVAGLRRNLLIDVHVGPYGQYRHELLDRTSGLARFGPNVVLLSLTGRDVLAGTSVTATAAEVNAAIGQTVGQLRMLWRKARDSFHAEIIQQTFLNVAEPLFGSYDRLVPGAPARLIAQLNDRTAEAAATDSASILDLARACERNGLDMWFDATRWLQGKFEIAPQAAPLYGDLVARIVAAQRGASRKCLVLDLDNTLWGGVIGDDGIGGIVLGEGSAAGEAHLALQRYAKQLRERGVILAVCSKNDPAIAESVFLRHPEMLLKRSDIAAFVANWEDKAINLKRVATLLNIGVDSLVFVDDNPAERARIRQSLPMVAVPELPQDPARYVRCLADAGYFEAVAFTSDDRGRGDQYAANATRTAFLESSESLDDFLRGLDMSVVFGPFQPVDLTRIAQLINKTNQFNPTTRRYSVEEVAAIAATQRTLTLQFRLLDRFGDNGIVSAMILRPDPERADILEIDTWVMSCRVFGRQLELEAMNIAVAAAKAHGAHLLHAHYIPTPKNGVVAELYAHLGFTRIAEDSPVAGAVTWELQVAAFATRPTHIKQHTEQEVG
jgi:FkbH-like protein